MTNDIPIGTLSISEQILKDQTPLRDRYDLVLVAVSWESRCHGCAYLLTGRADQTLVIHFASSDAEMEKRKKQHRETIEASLSDAKFLDLDRSSQFTENAKALETEITKAARTKGRALRVLMDMTCIPKRYLLFLMGLGFRREMFSSIDIIYSEAEKYEIEIAPTGLSGQQSALISEGEWTSAQIPYLEADNYVPTKRDLYISVGAELTQASPIVDRFEPNKLVLFHIKEGQHRLPSSVINREKPALDQLSAVSGVRQEYFGLHEIAGVATSVLKSRTGSTTCFAIGPKTHAVAFCLAALADDQIQVVCRTPSAYLVNEVKASGTTYFYRIHDRFDPYSFWDER
ncbi:hypothetical protein [Brucella pseudogrignonensis]|uniref:hypothetical protein n=1 Tax=Brucella pseudogrignonensis TaxID=419475 RepID=UPI000CFA9FB8|nr:hypothetical protein [Brucella pseudogrignonensis]MQP40445.1 hypothetical protein [Ochrobactrum sp. MYb237]PQZ39520.1 hypothetical protein CQ059_23415 [Brucella pseudogrignonensis]PRA40977.1 hypothetical protein CQ063_10620 [Brucella pseudogrignonensis]PRA69803.1 hypothetical protein CQ055_10505 [Brucella pseudogrignonensis]